MTFIRFIKFIFALIVMGIVFIVWFIMTPENMSHYPGYDNIVGKVYRTSVPLVISTKYLTPINKTDPYYGPAAPHMLLAGSYFYLRRVQAKSLSGINQYDSIIISTGIYNGRKVDTFYIWPNEQIPPQILPHTGHVSTPYIEEVSTGPFVRPA